ncbi:nitrate ABC transporter ATP-binding protein [Candidatus Parcubacteria bacterium]|nr:MAG: nitrate ABC transporter ATP-binding protein [Candidatus Parcubacteria bacterium]
MLNIKNLSIQYIENRHQVFKDVNFSVQKGEIVTLLGPSGCGKTTLLKTVSGLLGEEDIKIDGSIDFKDAEITTRIVFQTPRLLPWKSVEENISYGLRIKKIDKSVIDNKTKDAIQSVGLDKFKSSLPNKVSLGMKQRANFARALVCEPELLLLDEPFSALDVNTKKKLQKDFLSIIKSKKLTSIFVTHNIEEALELSDKIYVFFDGKVIKKGFYLNEFKKERRDHLYLDMVNYLKLI